MKGRRGAKERESRSGGGENREPEHDSKSDPEKPGVNDAAAEKLLHVVDNHLQSQLPVVTMATTCVRDLPAVPCSNSHHPALCVF